MSQNAIRTTFTTGGREVSIETGKLATQADGSVVVRCGDCMILATVVANKDAKEGQDFFPLSVDYQEKFAGAGRIPGNFFKREGRLSDYEILISRLVDRALRPLFPEDYLCDVQVILTNISSDKEIMPDCLAGLAASAAIALTDIPFNGPISEVRVARINGKFEVNPSRSALLNADLDVIIAGTEKNIMMVEGEANECSEQDLADAIKIGHEAIQEQIKGINALVALNGGKKEPRNYTKPNENEELKSKIVSFSSDKIAAIARGGHGKNERKVAFKGMREEFLATLNDEEKSAIDKKMLNRYFGDVEYDVIREVLLKDKIRLDGRKTDEIRGIWIEPNYIPSAHGSAVFTRGETQSLTTATLGTKDDEQLIDNALDEYFSKFILHYNFPAYSTGEIKPQRGPGRREVGHGNLAMRSLKKVLPDMAEFPYTIRIVSDILESNGSSSMATVCAGSLALFDAGVALKAPISGIAMGLVMNKAGEYAILSDILGDEDHLGDMDFKVTGTEKGICACQMDIKVDGLSYEVLGNALAQAREGRLHILSKMNEVSPAARAEYKSMVPKVETIIIDSEFIGLIIGPKGANIKEMQSTSGCVIEIEENPAAKKGIVKIFSSDQAAINSIVKKIKGMTTVPVVGEDYDSIVKTIMPYGAFVEFLPGKEGLLHISEVAWRRLDSLDGILKEGDTIRVKLTEIDQRSGKVKLSAKALIDRPQ
jgi:polyribonucleotide nucleotidyltransferase